MRTFVARVRRPVAALLLVQVTACYTYSPIETGPPPVGTEVRAQLTDNGAEQVRRRTSWRSGVVTGEVLGVTADSISLFLLHLNQIQGGRTVTFQDTVPIALADVTSYEERKFSALRTGAIAAGVVAGFAILIGGIVAASSDVGDGVNEEPEQSRLPSLIFGISIP